MAAYTVCIFYAYSFGMSNPKYSYIATTSYTESNESKPSYSNVEALFNFFWSHFAADLKTWNTFPYTYYIKATWLGLDDEVNE